MQIFTWFDEMRKKEEYPIGRQTVYLAMNFYDRYCSTVLLIPETVDDALKKRLYTIGKVSLALASKLQEEKAVPFEECTSDSMSVYDIEQVEFTLLKALKFEMKSITPFHYLEHMVTIFRDNFNEYQMKEEEIDIQLSNLKDEIGQLVLDMNCEGNLLNRRPFIIAAVATIKVLESLISPSISAPKILSMKLFEDDMEVEEKNQRKQKLKTELASLVEAFESRKRKRTDPE
ncbi:putative cyclin-D6-1 [Rosa sericea]